jgi:hypothetical protein
MSSSAASKSDPRENPIPLTLFGKPVFRSQVPKLYLTSSNRFFIESNCFCTSTANATPRSRRHAQLGEAGEALLLVVLLEDPRLVLVLDDVRQHRPAQEHHVLSPRRVLDAHLELAERLRLALRVSVWYRLR